MVAAPAAEGMTGRRLQQVRHDVALIRLIGACL